MDEIKIQGNIPMPAESHRNEEPNRSIMALLPEQSFFLPDGYKGRVGEKLRQYLQAVVNYTRQLEKNDKKFLVRLVVEEGKTGVRCWRKV